MLTGYCFPQRIEVIKKISYCDRTLSVNDQMTRIKKNIAYMMLVQGVTYLAPLVTLPYLTRVLGNETYGNFGFIQAIVQYFVLVTDYGFGITATRLIAIHRDDKPNISSVVVNTIAVKLALALLSGIISAGLCVIFPQLTQHLDVLLACFIGVLGNALFPTWMFQGLERMRALAVIICLSRLLPLPFFFLWVHQSSDVVTAAALQNIPGMIAALFSFYYAYQQRFIGFSPVSLRRMKHMLSEGWAVFLSNMSTSFYTTVNGILIGMFAGPEQAAFFYATDKLRLAAQGLIQPIASVFFPRVVVLHEKNDQSALSHVIKKGGLFLISMELVCGLVMFFGADMIALHYLGAGFAPAALYLRSLAFLPVVIAVATILSQWRFQAVGQSVILSKIYLIAGPLHALYATYLTYQYHTYGLIVSLYLTEIGITAAMVILLKKKKYCCVLNYIIFSHFQDTAQLILLIYRKVYSLCRRLILLLQLITGKNTSLISSSRSFLAKLVERDLYSAISSSQTTCRPTGHQRSSKIYRRLIPILSIYPMKSGV